VVERNMGLRKKYLLPNLPIDIAWTYWKRKVKDLWAMGLKIGLLFVKGPKTI